MLYHTKGLWSAKRRARKRFARTCLLCFCRIPLLPFCLFLSLFFCPFFLSPSRSLSLSVVVSRSRPCVYTLVVVPFDASPLTHAFVRRRRRSTARQLTACCSFVAATDALTSTPDNCHTFTSGASTVNCSKLLSVHASPCSFRRLSIVARGGRLNERRFGWN